MCNRAEEMNSARTIDQKQILYSLHILKMIDDLQAVNVKSGLGIINSKLDMTTHVA